MTNSPALEPTLADFEAARENVRDVAIETPILHSNFLSNIVGAEVFLKAENLQRTGAYKKNWALIVHCKTYLPFVIKAALATIS